MKLLEAFIRMLFTGSSLKRRYLTKQCKITISRHFVVMHKLCMYAQFVVALEDGGCLCAYL